MMMLFLLLQLITSSAPTRLTGAEAAAAPTDISKNVTWETPTLEFEDSKGNKIEGTDVLIEDMVKINYNWQIPNSAKSGDYFTFKLPDTITAVSEEGSLDGYGTYKVTADGTVTITLSDMADAEDGIKLHFTYGHGKLNFTELGNKTVEIPIGDEDSAEVPITIIPPDNGEITKKGQVIGDGGKQTWTINANLEEKEMANAWIEEDPDAEIKYDSVKITTATVDVKGDVTPTDTVLTEGTDYTVENGNIHFIGAYQNTTDAFQITYNTVLTDPNTALTKNVNNTAKLHYDGGDTPSTPSVNVYINYKPHEMLSKSLVTTSDSNQDYTWQVIYNASSTEVSADTKLTDTLGKNQTFIMSGQTDGGIQVQYGVIWDGTSDVQVDGSVPALAAGTDYDVTYSDDKTKMYITLKHEISRPLVITYQSHVDGDVPSGGLDIDNTIDDGHNPTTDTGHVTPYEVNPGLGKRLKDVNQSQTAASWEIDVNQNHEKVNGYYFWDTLPDGLTLDKDSVKVVDVDKNNEEVTSGYTIDENLPTAEEATAMNLNGNYSSKKGFSIRFNNQITDHYLISYSTNIEAGATEVDDNVVDDPYGGHAQAGIPLLTDYKVGEQDTTDGTLTWKMYVNTNGSTLKSDAVLTDKITADQTYVPGSVKVYTADKTTDLNHFQPEEEVTSAFSSAITEPSDTNDQTLSVSFPEGSTETYCVEIKTRPSMVGTDLDQWGNPVATNYSDTGHFTNGGNETDLPSGDVPYQTTGKMLDKTNWVDPDNASNMDWRVTVNQAQAEVKDLTITDVASANQVVDLSSFTIKRAFLSEYDNNVLNDQPNEAKYPELMGQTEDAWTLVEGQDYSIEKTIDSTTGNTTITIKFLKTINESYFIDYQSTPVSGTSVTNSVKLTGTNVTTEVDKTLKDIPITISGGGGDGIVGNITVHKQDADDASTSLAGAKFQLVPENGNPREATTDDDGNIVWGSLVSGIYHLIETKAPDGYLINPEYAGDGKKLQIDFTDSNLKDYTYSATVKDSKNQSAVRLVKTDASTGRTLKGAVFDLYRKGTDTPVKTDLKTDKNGQINVTDLALGTYYFVETKAPAGYELDSQRQEVTATADNTTDKPAEITVTNKPKTILPFTGGRGAGPWLIVGLLGTALAGIAFHIRKEREVM